MCLEDFLDYMGKQLSGQVQDKREEDLSKEFKKLLQDSFRWYDKNADGIITRDELKVRGLSVFFRHVAMERRKLIHVIYIMK